MEFFGVVIGSSALVFVLWSFAIIVDMAITRELFENVISADKAPGVDAEFRERLEGLPPPLLAYQVGRVG